MGINPRQVPTFVTARSPNGLRRQMILVNARHGAFHRFFDIQFVNGRWYAWYFRDIEAQDIDQVSAEDSEGQDG